MTDYAELRAMFLRIAEKARAAGREWLAVWAETEAEKYKENKDG